MCLPCTCSCSAFAPLSPLPLSCLAGSIALAYALALALGLPAAAARATSLQAGMRDSALAAQLALASFPLQPFAAVPALASTCANALLATLLAAAWHDQPQRHEPRRQAAPAPASLLACAAAAAATGLRQSSLATMVQARDSLNAAVAPRLTALRRQAAALLSEPPPEPALVMFDDLPAGLQQERQPPRPSNPHAMNIVMVGAECAPYSKTGERVHTLLAWLSVGSRGEQQGGLRSGMLTADNVPPRLRLRRRPWRRDAGAAQGARCAGSPRDGGGTPIPCLP